MGFLFFKQIPSDPSLPCSVFLNEPLAGLCLTKEMAKEDLTQFSNHNFSEALGEKVNPACSPAIS